MGRNWRLVDTGLRSAAQNVALDRALLEARKAEEIPTTLRFFRTTHSALLGLQQSAHHELDVEYCRAHGIALQRRITGGPTYYTDPAQLGWSLYVDTREVQEKEVRRASRQLAHAVASAVSALGADARVRRHDEIEIDGRVIGGCGYASDANTVLFHGWLFLALDLDTFVQAVRMPAPYAPEHLRAAAGERFADLGRALRQPPDVRRVKHYIAEALESAFDAEFAEGDLSLSEESRYRAALPEIDTSGWIDMVTRPLSTAPQLAAVQRSGNAVLRAALIFDTDLQALKRIWLVTDRPPNPRRTLLDLEAALRDLPLTSVRQRIESFFASRPAIPDLRAADVANVIARALKQPLVSPNS